MNNAKNKPKMNSTEVTILILSITMFIIMIVYAVVMFECVKNKSFIFHKYVPPTPKEAHFYPQGGIVPLTAQEQKERAAFINNATRQKF